MIRVLEVLATLKRAGAETMVTSLVQGLDRTRFVPYVATLFDASPGDLEPELRGTPVHRLGKRKGLDLRMYPRLARVIREVRPDIIHTHSYVLRYVLPVAGRTKLVHTVHNLARLEVDAVGRLIHRIAFRRGAVPVAVGEEVARTFQAEYGFRPDVIRNGIDTARYRLPRTPRPVFTILAVARLELQKNLTVLADAVGQLPFEAELLIAGEGSQRAALEGRPRVTLLGVRSDIPQLLASADVFALSSDYEGYPVSMLEAMAAGVPVVATAVGGIPEIAGDSGILVSPRDSAALAKALTRVHEGGLNVAPRDDFDVEHMVHAYERLFERVCG